mmetsp:Transcript_76200/g.174564  ORF Transcript_76200/g.174564 Transcript_76200/m.174564 type:complete len:284 (-) Transcript_76200:147-998(-)
MTAEHENTETSGTRAEPATPQDVLMKQFRAFPRAQHIPAGEDTPHPGQRHHWAPISLRAAESWCPQQPAISAQPPCSAPIKETKASSTNPNNQCKKSLVLQPRPSGVLTSECHRYPNWWFRTALPTRRAQGRSFSVQPTELPHRTARRCHHRAVLRQRIASRLAAHWSLGTVASQQQQQSLKLRHCSPGLHRIWCRPGRANRSPPSDALRQMGRSTSSSGRTEPLGHETQPLPKSVQCGWCPTLGKLGMQNPWLVLLHPSCDDASVRNTSKELSQPKLWPATS